MGADGREFQKYATGELWAWYRKLRIANKAHWVTAEKFKRNGLIWGSFSVSATAVAGTSVFANLTASPNYLLQVIAGFLTFVVVVSTALQNYLDYPRRAERHRQVGIAFGNLKRWAKTKLANPPSTRKELEGFLENIRWQWNDVAQDEPSIPQKLLKKVTMDVESNSR